MTRRISVAVAGCAAAAAIFWVATALAAYSSPRLHVVQVGDRVTLDVAQSAGDDATAIVRIISPLGTEIAAARPAGTTVGTADASFASATDSQIETRGTLRVVGPPTGAPTDCAVGERVVSVWSLSLSGSGLTVDLPVYLLIGGDLLLCLPAPSTLGSGAKLVGLRLTLDGPLDLPSAGIWISILIPYGGEVADISRAVASPALFGAGTVTFTARANGKGAVLVGFVRQAGSPRTGARVRITGGPRAATQRVLGTATTNLQGQFTFRAKSGTFFRATAIVPRASPPGICFVLEAALRPIPCINPSLNGFSVQSSTIRKR